MASSSAQHNGVEYIGCIKIWDAKSGQCVGTLGGHSECVYSVCWSPDGKWLASGSVDKNVKIWDAKSGQCVGTLEGHSEWVYSVCWSPDGKYLASGSADNTVIIWDANNGECIRTLKGHLYSVKSVSWSPDGKYLASGSAQHNGETYIGCIKIWDAIGGKEIQTLHRHSSFVESVCWSPDGKYLASGSEDGTIIIWSVEGNQSYYGEVIEEEIIFEVVEESASFPGGMPEMYKYIENNLVYPEQARENGVQGKVFISFVVEKDGSLTNFKVLRDIGYGCGEEAVRVVKSMPKWKPAKQRGKPVRMRFNLPISFTSPK